MPSASSGNATDTADAERVTLTVSPVFGAPQFLSDSVYTLDVATDTIIYQEIRQSDGTILGKDVLRAGSADVVALLQAIDKHMFFSLPDLIEAVDVFDGSYCYLTVETRQAAKTCGGLNAFCSKNQDFVTIYEAFDRMWQNAERPDVPVYVPDELTFMPMFQAPPARRQPPGRLLSPERLALALYISYLPARELSGISSACYLSAGHYRDLDGELLSRIKRTLDDCRADRNEWIAAKNA